MWVVILRNYGLVFSSSQWREISGVETGEGAFSRCYERDYNMLSKGEG